MNSVSSVYSLVRDTVSKLTGVEVYQLKGRSIREVDAKWLFAKGVYYLFYISGALEHLPRPYLYDISYQLGYNCIDSITNLLHKYVPSEGITELSTQLNAYCLNKVIKNDKI